MSQNERKRDIGGKEREHDDKKRKKESKRWKYGALEDTKAEIEEMQRRKKYCEWLDIVIDNKKKDTQQKTKKESKITDKSIKTIDRSTSEKEKKINFAFIRKLPLNRIKTEHYRSYRVNKYKKMNIT